MNDGPTEYWHRAPQDQDAADERLERRLEHALAAAPAIEIPEDFAARVAARLPPAAPALASRNHYARKAMLGCGVVLFVVMFVLVARMHRGSSGSNLLELLFSAELVIIALVAGPWRRGLGSGG